MTDKTCPFRQGFNYSSFMYVSDKQKNCNRAGCQLWVKLVKDRLLVISETNKMIDPDAEYTYEGCGLVTAIPWILVNKTKVKKE